MHNDSLLYKVLAAAILLLLAITTALPAVMQDSPGPAIPNDAFAITGMLESISMQEIVLDGVAVDIRLADLNTRLTLGDVVRAEGSLNEGVFTARWIGPPAAQNPGSGSESSGSRDTFEFRGMIDNAGDEFLIVSGQQINTANLNTQFPSTIGQIVRVRGTVENGVFAPRTIQAANSSGLFDDDFDDRFDDDGRDLNIPADCTVNAPAGWVSYTIRRGDSLSSIATRSGSSVAQLVQVNCLSNPRMIIAGTSLFLPRTPTNFPGSNRNNESSNSRSFNSRSSSNSGGGSWNESSFSSSRNAPSRPSRSNESSGSGSNSNSASNS